MQMKTSRASPVKAKLVEHPGDWPWSSWCHNYRGAGLLKMGSRVRSRPTLCLAQERRTLCKNRKGYATQEGSL